MQNLKCKKQNILIILVIFIMVFVFRVVAFRDLNSEVNEAAEEFSNEGMFGSFIYQYGQDLFRPDGNVTRANLILALKEYHVLTKRLLSQNKLMLNRVHKLEEQKLSEQNMELMLQKFKKTLEPMLRNSKTILQLKQQIEETPALAAASSGSEYGNFRDDFESVDNEGMLMLKSDLRKIKNEITGLNKAVFAQRKYVSEMAREKKVSSSAINRLQSEFDSINKKMKNLEKLYKSKGKVMSDYDSRKKDTVISKSELNKIKNDMKDLKANISEHEKYIKEISREETFKSSGGDMIPFWVKISMGFTTIALFFMAR